MFNVLVLHTKVKTSVWAALVDKLHPEFGDLNLAKKSLDIKTNQKRSLEKDDLHVHAFFLQVSWMRQFAYQLTTI